MLFSITNLYESIFAKTSILYTIYFLKKHWIIYNWGFNIGQIINSTLLNSPLLSWDGILNKEYFIMMLLYILDEVMLIGTKSNRNHFHSIFFYTKIFTSK